MASPFRYLGHEQKFGLDKCNTHTLYYHPGGETVKTYRGRPILSARMPQAYIDGLHKLADRRGCTMADILRELVRDELRSEHIPTTLQPAQGQTRMPE